MMNQFHIPPYGINSHALISTVRLVPYSRYWLGRRASKSCMGLLSFFDVLAYADTPFGLPGALAGQPTGHLLQPAGFPSTLGLFNFLHHCHGRAWAQSEIELFDGVLKDHQDDVEQLVHIVKHFMALSRLTTTQDLAEEVKKWIAALAKQAPLEPTETPLPQCLPGASIQQSAPLYYALPAQGLIEFTLAGLRPLATAHEIKEGHQQAALRCWRSRTAAQRAAARIKAFEPIVYFLKNGPVVILQLQVAQEPLDSEGAVFIDEVFVRHSVELQAVTHIWSKDFEPAVVDFGWYERQRETRSYNRSHETFFEASVGRLTRELNEHFTGLVQPLTHYRAKTLD